MEYKPDGRFLVVTPSELPEFIDKVLSHKFVSIDTETYYDKTHPELLCKYIKGNPQNRPFIVTMSLSSAGGYKIYINDNSWKYILKVLQSTDITKIMFNADYDIWMLQNENIVRGGNWQDTVRGTIHDVAIIHHLINEEDKDTNGHYLLDLKGLSNKYIDNSADRFEQLVDQVRTLIAKTDNKPKDEVSYKDVDNYCPDLMTDYASSDTMLTTALYRLWMPLIEKWQLQEVFNIEMDCIYVINRMERAGIQVDTVMAKEMKEQFTAEREEVDKQIYDLIGHEFNINSGDEVVEVIRSLGIEYNWRNKEGNITVDDDHIKLVDHPVVPLIQQHRRLSKLVNTYIDNILYYTQADGRIHATYWQTGARTGRMSSSSPNFQNQDPDVKCCYTVTPGYTAIFADFKQQEYRVLAHYAEEEAFIEAAENGLDIHTKTAAMMTGKPYDEITGAERKRGKTMNFANVYQIGLAALAAALGEKIDPDTYSRGQKVLFAHGYKPWAMPTLDVILAKLKDPLEIEDVSYLYKPEVFKCLGVAKKFKADYFRQFPKIKQYIDTARQETASNGFIRTFYGSIKHYDDPKKEAYKGINAQVQGTSAYITKKALIALDNLLLGTKSRLVNTVHDSFEIEVHNSEMHLVPQIEKVLENHEFRVPIGVDLEYSATRWSEKHDWEGAVA